MNFAPGTTPEEKFQLLEANIITEINEIRKNKDGVPEDLYKCFLTISNGFFSVKKFIHQRLSLYGENIILLLPIYEGILEKIIIVKTTGFAGNNLISRDIEEGHYFDFFIYDNLFLIKYIVRNNINDSEFDLIYNDIVRKGTSLDQYFDKNLYTQLLPPLKEKFSEAIIGLKNTLADNFGNGSDLDNSKQNVYFETFKSISELNKLRSQVEEIKDSHEILTRIKENKAYENTYELNHGYIDEVDKLYKEINSLNRIIIILFIGIVAIITIKLSLIIFFEDFFRDIYNFLTYLSLLVSFSALITYLIKERSRLIRLHDFFNLTALKLRTLPQYMRELDSKQRQELIVTLSSSFFTGSDKFPPENTQQQNNLNENLPKIVADIIKIINDQKK